jgi:hypothetical protein
LSLPSFPNPIKGLIYLFIIIFFRKLARDFTSENIIAYLQKSL